MSQNSLVLANQQSRQRILHATGLLSKLPYKDQLTVPISTMHNLNKIASYYEKEVEEFTDFVIRATRLQLSCPSNHLIKNRFDRDNFFTYELLSYLRSKLIERDPMMMLSEVPIVQEIKIFQELSYIALSAC